MSSLVVGAIVVPVSAATTLRVAVVWGPGVTETSGFEPAAEAFKELYPDVEVEIIWETGLSDQLTDAPTAKYLTMLAVAYQSLPDGSTHVVVSTGVLGNSDLRDRVWDAVRIRLGMITVMRRRARPQRVRHSPTRRRSRHSPRRQRSRPVSRRRSPQAAAE